MAIIFIFSFFISSVLAADFESVSPERLHKETQVNYLPGELIIKFKERAAQAIDKNLIAVTRETLSTQDQTGKGLVSTETVFEINPGQTGLDSINTLNIHYTVEKMAPVFGALKEEQLSTGMSSEEFYRNIKNAFPRRAERASQDLPLPNLFNIYKMELADKNADIVSICNAYKKDPNVAYCQPNYVMSYSAVSVVGDDGGGGGDNRRLLTNDTYIDPDRNETWSTGAWGQSYEDMWGLKIIRADLAWIDSKGQGVTVAVVDTGVNYTHPDISGNIWINSCEDINNNGRVDTSDFNGVDNACPNQLPNGYVDDIRGWDFANGDNDPQDPTIGHGTHVAGTIAAVGNNGLGVAGVAYRSKIMAVKGFADDGSGNTANLADGIIYAAKNGADVINNSWGCLGGCPSNRLAEDAVNTAYGLGAVVVFSAGNDNTDIIRYSPQNMTNPKPVVVAASTPTDTKASFSSFGLLVDVAAPGVDVLSLRAPGTDMYGDGNHFVPVGDPNAQYYRANGTSMAAPHVSGLAALILAYRPDFTNEDVRQILRASADDILTPGFDIYSGAGRINARKALNINSAPQIKINAPAKFSQQNSPVTITGSATVENFKQYQIFYGLGNSPSEWLPIGSPVLTPIVEGTLGMWPVTSRPDGLYMLRLVVTTLSGLQFQDFARIQLERSPSIQVTSDSGIQWRPVISGNLIAWEDRRNGNYDIYLYDLTNSSEHQITTSSQHEQGPDISGNRIVWYKNSGVYLCEYNAQSGLCPEHFLGSGGSPAISGNRIVWHDSSGIYACTYNSGNCSSIKQITNVASAAFPKISGDLVVWPDLRNGNYDVYLYDLATDREYPITNNPGREVDPVISGNRIAWSDDRNGNSDIYLCGYTSGVGCGPEQLITNNSADQYWISMDGDMLVWVDLRDGNQSVYQYNLRTGVEEPVQVLLWSDTAGWFPIPDISGNKVVWFDSRSGNMDIYYKLIEIPAQRSITITQPRMPPVIGE